MFNIKAVVLLSGGMDSTTALAHTIERLNSDSVLAISFNYGQRHSRELNAAYEIAQHYGLTYYVVGLGDIGKLLSGSALTDPEIEVPEGHYEAESMKITVVPNRNSIMLSIAFGIARAQGATSVVAGMHAGDHAIYPDCRKEFVDSFNETMLLANADLDSPPILDTPFILMSKADIVRVGVGLEVPFDLTYSCYKGEITHCGKCGTCTERREAFQLAHVPDPTVYSAR